MGKIGWKTLTSISLIPVLVTGIQRAQVLGRERLCFKLFTAQTRGGWIPVTSTGMRDVEGDAPTRHP
ncbi:hypothetical protein AMC82_CH02987 [Rhizobium phaseoli]|nr:hypothetical protein AMC84_CH02999 [Rhizobium phaseoli]ANL79425.1 hypothetical protein AMC82_CH02987 [Rhizobium phaseoli]